MRKLLLKSLIVFKVKFDADFRWSVFYTDVNGINDIRVINSVIQLMCYDFSLRIDHVNLTKIMGETWTLFKNVKVTILFHTSQTGS